MAYFDYVTVGDAVQVGSGQWPLRPLKRAVSTLKDGSAPPVKNGT